jgi:hypothetical protein
MAPISKVNLSDRIDQLGNFQAQVKNLINLSDKVRRVRKQYDSKLKYMKGYGQDIGINLKSKSFRMIIDELEYKIKDVI